MELIRLSMALINDWSHFKHESTISWIAMQAPRVEMCFSEWLISCSYSTSYTWDTWLEGYCREMRKTYETSYSDMED